MDEDLKALTELVEGVKVVLAQSGELRGMIAEDRTKLAECQVVAKKTEEWLSDLERRVAAKRFPYNGGDRFMDALPEPVRRKYLPIAEIACHLNKAAQKVHPQHKQQGIFNDDPAAKILAGLYMQGHLTALTDPQGFRGIAEQHDKVKAALSVVEKAAMGEDTAALGGNLVPVVLEGEILRLIQDNGIMRPLVRKVPMTTKTHNWPTRANAFSAFLVAETGTITDSAPASPFGQSALTAKMFAGFATVSQQLLQDNIVGLADYLATEFAEQIALLEDQQALEGDGTGQNFTGVVAASGVVAISSGANGDFLNWAKLIDCLYGPTNATATNKEQAAIAGQRVFLPTKVLSTILRTRADAAAAADNAGNVLWAPDAGFTGRPAPSMLGFPLHAMSSILVNRTVGTGGNRANLYTGPPETIIFGDLLGFQFDLNPWSKFQTVQIDVRGIKRTGILVAVPTAWTKYTAIDPAGLMVAK